MAVVPYFIISPTSILSLIGLWHGPDKITPTPTEDWNNVKVDLVIPAHNEIQNIVLCLESLTTQTLQPRKILLFDDASSDSTFDIAAAFVKEKKMSNVEIVRKQVAQGKTPIIHQAATESDADVLVVLDADTFFISNNYIETLVKELYQGVGIACACGVILPSVAETRKKILEDPVTADFVNRFPGTYSEPKTFFERFQQGIVDDYREELYLFLEKFIYHGEMVFFGTIINPVGCAVAYRRKYILDVLNHYHTIFGHDLTTSEDIFIGFAFADRGYRNIQINNVYAGTKEPKLSYLPKQIYKWSSAYLQSCFYFPDLLSTPMKYPRLLFRKAKRVITGENKKIQEKRKIKEAYRQSFGDDYTKKYGRPIGWFMFTSLLEKICFPIVIILFIVFGYWEALLITIIAEAVAFSALIVFMHRPRRVKNFFKSLTIAPIRYTVLLYELFIMAVFAKDLLTGNRKWRK